ncbi:MAG: glycosyltransferase family 2 protein, partial [Flavobacteriales bacterium]|nr:glycosyltransferase family 2 protein [Flavobacteriales bacterium]
MPVKNASAFLHQTIDSIINQTYSNWELIAINDHSSDDSLETLNIYSNKCPNIIVLKNQGNGIIDALKTGYNNSNGQFITRMDADDLMSHNKLELMVNALKNGKGNIVTGLVKYFSEGELGNGYKNYEKWLNGLTLSNQNYSEIYKECSIPSPCWLVWKEDFDLCGGFNSNTYPED